jgi:hypothetical protein
MIFKVVRRQRFFRARQPRQSTITGNHQEISFGGFQRIIIRVGPCRQTWLLRINTRLPRHRKRTDQFMPRGIEQWDTTPESGLDTLKVSRRKRVYTRAETNAHKKKRTNTVGGSRLASSNLTTEGLLPKWRIVIDYISCGWIYYLYNLGEVDSAIGCGILFSFV